jgi:UDP-glucose 4-epimerase
MKKHVLLLGGAGYIGHHILYQLLKNTKHDIVVADNLSTGKLEHVNSVENIFNKKVAFEFCDITSKQEVKNLFESYDFSYVICLAGLKSVEEGENNPDFYYKTNVDGLQNVLTFAASTSKPQVIYSSSACVYSEHGKPIDENWPIEPQSVYGKTKLDAESLVEYYSVETNTSNLIFRYFNPIGRTEGLYNDTSKTNLIPCLLRAVETQGSINLYGKDYPTFDGTCERDYIHVEDIAKAHLHAFDFLNKNVSQKISIFNLGTGQSSSTLEIVENFVKEAKSNDISLEFAYKPRRNGDDAFKCASISAAIKHLHWTPKLLVSQAIRSVF